MQDLQQKLLHHAMDAKLHVSTVVTEVVIGNVIQAAVVSVIVHAQVVVIKDVRDAPELAMLHAPILHIK